MPEQTKEVKPKKGDAVVTQRFRDKSNFDLVREPGELVSDLKSERINELVKAGVVEIVGEETTPADNPPA